MQTIYKELYSCHTISHHCNCARLVSDLVQNTPSVTASTVIMAYQPGMCSDLSTTDWSHIWVGILQYFAQGSDMQYYVFASLILK